MFWKFHAWKCDNEAGWGTWGWGGILGTFEEPKASRTFEGSFTVNSTIFFHVQVPQQFPDNFQLHQHVLFSFIV